jgi:F0F1-type ATP synthase membrane subunit c/vacuolar-type H+-ATPase subunit K
MATPDPKAMTLRIVWAALLSALAIYAALTFILQPPEGHTVPDNIQTLQIAFAGIALSMGPAILIMRQILFWKPYARGEVSPEMTIPRYFTASIVSWAMCESIAIYGLVLYMLSYQRPISLAFMGASALGMLALAPLKLPEPRQPSGDPNTSW